MTVQEIVDSEAFKSVIRDYRSMCHVRLEYGREVFSFQQKEILLALDNLEKYGDMRAYRFAGEIRQWL